MSMRKFIRNRLHFEAEKLGVKPAEYVRRKFESYSIKKYGKTLRLIHKARGTKKYSTWRLRVKTALLGL